MAVREQVRAVLRQVVVHPKMVADPNLAQGARLLVQRLRDDCFLPPFHKFPSSTASGQLY